MPFLSLYNPQQYILSQEHSLIAPFLSGQSLNYTLIARNQPSDHTQLTIRNITTREYSRNVFNLLLLPSERLSAATSLTDGFCAFSKEHTLLSKYCLEISAMNLHKYAHMHTNVCPIIDAYMHICHQKDLSIIRIHTHRANLKTFLQASCEYQKTWKETGSSTAIPNGPSVSGNVNLPCLHRF